MNQELDKALKTKLQFVTARLQQSRNKADSFRKHAEYEETEQKKLIGQLELLKEMIEANV
jgi:hypothetical protein